MTTFLARLRPDDAVKNYPIDSTRYSYPFRVISPSRRNHKLENSSVPAKPRKRATFIDSLSPNVPGIKRRSKYSTEKHNLSVLRPRSFLARLHCIFTHRMHTSIHVRIDTLIVYKYQKDFARFDIAVSRQRG